jgi:excinuclease ABC subunit A
LAQDYLEIRGARVHNLKNVDLRLPHNQLTVVTGVSGSGKSSLVFDTVYAEGQRRYVESLSAYARQFLERMEKPDVDELTGIAPAVAIRQKNSTRNPRSTVATSTEIYDFLRLLFARAGQTYCGNCGRQVYKDTVDQAAEQVLAWPERSRWYVLFPVLADAEHKDLKDRLAGLRSKGFNRLFQDGKIYEFSTPESLLEVDFERPVSVLVDRLAISPDSRERIVDAIEIAYREAQEVVFEAAEGDPPERKWYSERFECRQCAIPYIEPEPRLFSFNNPFGACPRCQGFGDTVDYDMNLIVPDRFMSLKQGAVEPFTKPKYVAWQKNLLLAAKRADVRIDVPYHELTADELRLVMDGDAEFKGINGFFAFLETKKYKMAVRILLARYRGYTRCPDCQGGRLRKEALNVQFEGKTIRDVVQMTLELALAFFESLQLRGEQAVIGDQLVLDIKHRLQFLNEVGLEYLTLDRLASTLSGGEAQRIQLATSLGSRLVGACYVLDEPSIGLHSRDTARLVGILERLRDLGNTILVVEHDPDVMRSADHIVDMGPGAGELGGEVIFEGTLDALTANGTGRSLTAKYLSGKSKIAVPKKRRKASARKKAFFEGAAKNNLKSVNVAVSAGIHTVVTGVSGSGKSTLVHDVVYEGLNALAKQDIKSAADTDSLRLPCRKITGAATFEEVILVDQSPIGRSPRSNPVTYVKAFDEIRRLFAFTPEARKKGLMPGAFSFNVAGGRCETCQGDGTVTVEMQFLADVALVCEECGGKRFGPEVLAVRYDGKNIYDVLQLTVDQAMRFFARAPRVTSKLSCLAEVGLGYLRLGQSATTLSGGEAQRVKLAAYVAQSRCDDTLYIFDEPTTGLHFDDIAKLLKAFDRLIDSGGTILTIEHNMDVIKCADWVVDLGPEGGDKGGEIVAEGTPEDVAKSAGSYTARFLKAALKS